MAGGVSSDGLVCCVPGSGGSPGLEGMLEGWEKPGLAQEPPEPASHPAAATTTPHLLSLRCIIPEPSLQQELYFLQRKLGATAAGMMIQGQEQRQVSDVARTPKRAAGGTTAA